MIIMQISGALVDRLCKIAQEVYSNYVVQEGNQKMLYFTMLKALYGILVALLLYYRDFERILNQLYLINCS